MTRVPVNMRRSHLVPPGFAAWVPLRRTILIKPGAEASERRIAHELVHVHQAERSLWPLAYVIQWAATGFSYKRMPYEVEARASQNEPFYRAWARDLLEAWSDS
jgi:hypothetical protein